MNRRVFFEGDESSLAYEIYPNSWYLKIKVLKNFKTEDPIQNNIKILLSCDDRVV